MSPVNILPTKVVEQAKEIGRAISKGSVAPLIGAGLSYRCGLPGWGPLVDRLILAWREWERALDKVSATELKPEEYVKLVRGTFKTDLAVVSYIRRRVKQEGEPNSFEELLYGALYSQPSGGELVPVPDLAHYHLVELFHGVRHRIWTTNYDDLLECSARRLGIMACPVAPPVRRVCRSELKISHLHGFMPPRKRAQSYHDYPGLNQAPVVLAEDDYHGIVENISDWTRQEFNQLFTEHQVLILGMSLTDPNVRRVVMSSKPIENSPHFLVIRPPTEEEILRVLPDADESSQKKAVNQSESWLNWYWDRHGVETVGLPDYKDLLPFLMRLRYESYMEKPGDLWRKGADIGYGSIDDLWESHRQNSARAILQRAQGILEKTFGSPGEVVEIGVYLLKPPDGKRLELVFRGRELELKENYKKFLADPDRIDSVVGKALVSGGLVVEWRDNLTNYGKNAVSRARSNKGLWKGIVAAPIIYWAGGGIPLGAIFVTTSNTDGVLFRQVINESRGSSNVSRNDVYAFLQQVAMDLLKSATPGEFKNNEGYERIFQHIHHVR